MEGRLTKCVLFVEGKGYLKQVKSAEYKWTNSLNDARIFNKPSYAECSMSYIKAANSLMELKYKIVPVILMEIK